MMKTLKYLMVAFTIITAASCKNEKQTPKEKAEITNKIEKR